MRIQAILFDLDGTLLPMEQDVFAKAYIGGLVKVAAARGYDSEKTARAIVAGTEAMVKNNGQQTNETVFWKTLELFFGPSVYRDIHMFDEFYRTDFSDIRNVCGYSPYAKEAVTFAKNSGFRVALATNPLFPSVATEERISWAGLSVRDFEFFTSYETSQYCKPNLDYYRTVFDRLALKPEECVMVGNDVGEDMTVSQLGTSVFLLDDCLINRKGEDVSAYPGGNFEDLLRFLRDLKEKNF